MRASSADEMASSTCCLDAWEELARMVAWEAGMGWACVSDVVTSLPAMWRGILKGADFFRASRADTRAARSSEPFAKCFYISL